MEQKRCSVTYVALTLLVTWIRLTGANKFDFPAHLRGVNYSATEELEKLKQPDTVDLGDDIYDDDGPIHIRNALVNATLSHDPSLNQYSHHDGHPRLLKAVAKMYSKILNRELDPKEDVLITIGATEAVYLAFHGHTTAGDEWIVIEPAYTMYIPMIKLAKGVPRFTSLKPTKTNGTITGDDWAIDKVEMESLFNNKTKGILLNNPLNPLGKVYTLEELTFIADLAKKYDTLVVSDEAHEWVTHRPHIRIASLPGMFERTISIGTASKSFSLAGWRIGWAYGPANILNHLKTVHSRATDSVPTPQQEAIAYAFEKELKDLNRTDSFFAVHVKDVKDKQELMLRVLNDAGLQPIVPAGGFCIFAKWTTLKSKPVKRGGGRALNFAKWMIKKVGLLALPGADYFSDGHRQQGEDYVRFCVHKHADTIQGAVEKLEKLKSYKGW